MPAADKAVLTTGLQLTLPLSKSEHSLNWPIRNQLALAYKERRSGVYQHNTPKTRSDPEDEWLLNAAGLPPHALDGIEHSPTRSMLGITFQSAQAWNTYAVYYDSLIKASESGATRLPLMREVDGTIGRGMSANLVTRQPFESGWEIFHRQLMETDARLRLASP